MTGSKTIRRTTQAFVGTVILLFFVTPAFGATIDYATQVQPIFGSGSRCNGCHPNSGGMDLSPANSYNSIVQTFRNGSTTQYRVVRYDPVNSYLMTHVINNGGHNGVTVTAAQQTTISTWITEGAFANLTAVASPGVSPAAGSFSGSVTVTITPAAGTEARYTTDGTTPTRTSTLYSAPLVFAATTTIKVIGIDNAKPYSPDSAVVSNTYTITAATPTLTAVSPNSGPVAGGTSVTLTGTNFAAGATVTVGGTAATGITVGSAASITCTTPAGTAGARDVVVTVSGGSVTLTGGFTYVAAPTVASISPNSGPLAGGTSVTVTGANFVSGATTVTIGGTAATSMSVASATSLTCVTPARTAGAQNVVVTTGGGSATLTGGFTYLAAPTVASIIPNSGPAGGGTSVTVAGTNFVTGATTVTIGGAAAASVSVASATSLTCVTPAGTAGAQNAVVTTGGGSATLTGGFTYTNAPTIASISPNSGPAAGGRSVTVAGTAFVVSGTTVTFGGAAATGVIVASATSLTCSTPAGVAGAQNVVVTTSGGSATSVGGFLYVAPPSVASISPNNGPAGGGTSVTIAGTNFVTGATTVTIGGVAATGVTVASATSLTCATPAGTVGAKSIIVTTAGGTATLTNGFTYTTAPTVTAVSPNTGPSSGGQAVTVTGTNFVTGATTVTVGGAAATSITVASATSLTCVTPAGTSGAQNVVVTTAGGSATLTGGYTYLPAPTVAAVNPSSGSAAGGQTITITGTGFVTGATAVTVGGAAATSVTVASATWLTCVTPAGAAGAQDIAVTTANGRGTLAGAYTSVGAPTITAVSPNAGAPAGGTSVTITGANFVAGATVTIGGMAATAITVTSATAIACSTPAHAAGTADVSVSTVGGSATLAAGFNFTDALAVSSVSPNRGSVGGGQNVTITGAGFAAPATIAFGGVAATAVSVASGSSITCTTPSHAAGTVDVVVTSGAANATLASAYTYANAVDFVTQVEPLFNAGYGCSGCHSAGGAANMDLTTGNAYANLVNVASVTSPGMVRVQPFDVANSVLPQMISFPHNGKNVSASDLALIEDWIAQGALAGLATASAPTFSPMPGTFTSAQSVTLASTTPGAQIYYTSDGTTPTASSTLYVGPINAATTMTIKALAAVLGMKDSAVASATYTVNLASAVATPTFSPPAGTYTSAQSVATASTTPNAAIHYTTDGTTPTSASTLYAGPIAVSTSMTIKAIGTAAGLTDSGVATAVYALNLPVAATPTFTPPGGPYTSAQTVTIATAAAGTTIHYTTDGSAPTAASAPYSGPIAVSATTTLKAVATGVGFSDSAVAAAVYTIGAPMIDYATQIQPIFDGHGCAGCHTAGGTGSAHMDLSPAGSYASLVNGASTTAPGSFRVVPFDPASSVLVKKTSMTHNGITLSATEKATIETWITQGAPAAGGGGSGGNRPPVITTALSATPNPAKVGNVVSFFVGASDPDGDTLTYTWDFGAWLARFDPANGTPVLPASQPNQTYQYSMNGTFTVTVTIADGNGGVVSSSTVVTVASSDGGALPPVDFATQIEPLFTTHSCTNCHDAGGAANMNLTAGNAYANLVNVAAIASPGKYRVKPGDAGNSLIYNQIVTHHNGAAFSADETALVQAWINQGALAAIGGGAATPMTISKCIGKVKFGVRGLGLVTAQGTLPAVTSFDPTGKTVTVNVGGIPETFTLNSHGAAKSVGRMSSIGLKLKKTRGAFAGGTVPFKVMLRGYGFAEALQLDQSAAVKQQPRTISVAVSLDGVMYSDDFDAHLTSVPHKQAMFK